MAGDNSSIFFMITLSFPYILRFDFISQNINLTWLPLLPATQFMEELNTASRRKTYSAEIINQIRNS